ncbi:hypothetical protein SAMN04488107_3228 [Geodermatophilus saharensis]|uniref:DNA-directed RNA polymerase specialized sigma subunit, sigma24 family n=1 Tax=Geodermatophilus saharensis TaxID=1137994 RepID=A0A239G0Q5_9ACTN|nr:hypothetical protein [Geodermatophilus saharensis]SNS62719.1 hypothetical protein SAMN04488107_3228 [Geodermatophilus saharensis]
MTGDDEAAFGRFVAAERDALLDEALRLTGDPVRAEDAVQSALASARLRWGRRGADPAVTAADALARTAARRGLLGGGGQVLESLDGAAAGPPARWRLDVSAAAADALARVRRRRRLRAGAAAAVLAAAAAVAPQVLPPRHAPAAPGADDGGVLTGPARGPLAADPAFVAAVRSAAPGGEGRVVLATDTPHGRVVLLAGSAGGVWLTGPVGAAPGALTPAATASPEPDRPASLLLGGPGPATLVVVAAPGDEVEVSRRLEVDRRGATGRTWEPVPVDDGVAVTVVPTTPLGAGTAVRVLRDGRPVHRGAPATSGPPAGAAVVPPLEPVRPAAVRPAPRLVAEALTEVAVPLAADPAELEPRLLWSGTLPLADVPGTVAVVVARSPQGGLVVTTRAGQLGRSGAGRTVGCGLETAPGSTDVAGLTVAGVCDLSSPETEPSDQGRWLVVTAPAAAIAADVLDARGSVLTTVALADGGGSALLPAGAREMRTIDGAGRTLAEVPIGAATPVPFGR